MSTTIDGSAGVTTNSGAVYNGIASGTAVASTSGTSIDFTGIPSWVKRITVMFNGVSTSGTSKLLVRVGTGGTPTITGYTSQAAFLYSVVGIQTETTGFQIYYDLATYSISGSMVIQNITGNTWVMNGTGTQSAGTAYIWNSGGNVALAGVLNFLRVTTLNGTDTFDAGSINILYE